MWHSLSGSPAGVLQRIVDDYSAETGHGVELVNKASALQLVDDFARSAEEQRPDVMLVGSEALARWTDAQAVVPIGRCISEGSLDSMVPLAESSYRRHDEQIAVPFNVSTPVLLYRSDLLEQAEVDAGQLTDLAAIRDAAEAVVSKLPNARGLTLDGNAGDWFVRQRLAQLGQMLVEPDNGHVRDGAAEIDLDNPTVRRDLELIQQMVQEGSATDIGPNLSSKDDLLALLDAEHPAALTLHTSAALGELRQLALAHDVDFDLIGVAPFPGDGTLVGGGGLWLAAGEGHDRGSAAKLIEYLISPETQAELSVATGYVPANREALEVSSLNAAWADDARLRVGYDQIADIEPTAARAGAVFGVEFEANRRIGWAVEQIVDGRPVDDALSEAAANIDGLIDVYRSVV